MVETRAHVLNDCSRFTYKSDDRMVIKHFVLFLTDNPGAFAWSSNMGAITESPSTTPSFLFSSSFLTSLVSGSVSSDLCLALHFPLCFSLYY